MTFEELTIRFRAGQLEVEDVLSLALNGESDSLRAFRTFLVEDAPGDVLIHWVDVVVRFLRDGYQGLRDYLGPQTRPFVYGLLEVLRSAEGMGVIAFDITANGTGCMDRTVYDTINAIMSFPAAPAVGEQVLLPIREFLHDALAVSADEPTRAAVLYALRGVGDASTLLRLDQIPPLNSPYERALKLAKVAIRRRCGV